MDEATAESLHFLLVAVVTLAVLGLLSRLMSWWLHGHPGSVLLMLVAGIAASHRLTDRGTVAVLCIVPLPPESGDAP